MALQIGAGGLGAPERRLRIGIVVPWYGDDLRGGAERTAWQIAHGLVERGHSVVVFTTCARSFADDWGTNVYPAGSSFKDGIEIRRFPVNARDRNAFEHANEILLSKQPGYYRAHPHALEPETARTFVAENITSSSAIADLRASIGLDGTIVLPYPFGLSIDAAVALGSRAILLPCLHDESYAYLPAVEDAFRTAGMILFNTAAERRVAYRIYGPAIALKSTVIGQWVDLDQAPPLDRIRSFRPSEHRYILYLGRRDATKSVDTLVESFATFRRRERMSQLTLVLAGPGQRSFGDPKHDIIDLGEVSERQKTALLMHAIAVVQPSINESFSRVLMEAWSHGTPVAVNERCQATADAVRESGAGWLAGTKAQWSTLFHEIDRLPNSRRAAYGERGRLYVHEETSREQSLDRLESVLRSHAKKTVRTRFDSAPEFDLIHRLDDGRRLILYAGPLLEYACVEQLLGSFAHLLSFGIDARLALLGRFDSSEELAGRFFRLVAQSGLQNRVSIVDDPRQGNVAACYRSADLFWSFSEIGPAAELLDALGYGVPVLAYSNPAAAEILGASGLLFTQKGDLRVVAGIAALSLTDNNLRETLIDGQCRQFEALARRGELDLAG